MKAGTPRVHFYKSKKTVHYIPKYYWESCVEGGRRMLSKKKNGKWFNSAYIAFSFSQCYLHIPNSIVLVLGGMRRWNPLEYFQQEKNNDILNIIRL